ncbi:MAG: hypothetical protein KDD39_12690 [Bdellovibrionales bacterium]|nr:hypothetical protein [Bdellovibrionales bacterium]
MSYFFRHLRVFGFLIIAISLCSCASNKTKGDFAGQPYHTRIYSGTYDEVWLAALKALADYPLKISNKDVGKVHSEIINGPYNDLLFTYPDPIELPERFRYSMKLKFAKYATSDGQPLVRIRLIKELERYQDFYTGWVPFPSDGIEEKVLLYRVEHVLRMEQKLGSLGL